MATRKLKPTVDEEPVITGQEPQITLHDKKDGFEMTLRDSVENLLNELRLAKIDLEFAWKVISIMLREHGGTYSIPFEQLDVVEVPVITFSDRALTYTTKKY